jgi:hypothetical protein
MTDFVDTETDCLDVTNPGFEQGLGINWAVSQSKVYPDATWTREYSQASRTGDYCMKCTLDHAGANYRGSTWFYNDTPRQTTALGHAYRVTVYAREWRTGLVLHGTPGDWVLRIQVADDGGLNEHTDYAPGDISDTGYTACTHDFTGTGDDELRVVVYCIAEDTNAVEFPLLVDDISFTNLTKAGSWAAEDESTGSWMEGARPAGAWIEDWTIGDPEYEEEAVVTDTWTEVTS